MQTSARPSNPVAKRGFALWAGAGTAWPRRLAANTSGGVAIAFAICIPVLVGFVGLAVDYGLMLSARGKLQSAADNGALAGARELSLADAKRENVPAVVKSVVESFARVGLKNAATTIAANVQDNPLQVEVKLSQVLNLNFSKLIGLTTTTIVATSVARVVGTPNICVLALEPSEPAAISLASGSQLTGTNCAVFSNSRAGVGMSVQAGATLSATTVCSAGGISSQGNIDPNPYQDCPQFDDPLAGRPEPSVGGCDHIATVIALQTTTLHPGVYCLGLTIATGSVVHFEPGVYVIKDGPFLVAGSAEIKGEGVGFFLTGTSFFTFDPLTKIELSAPTDGPLAGLMFFGARSQSKLLINTILSDRAQSMTGTIYLPRNAFVADSLARIGATSAYTAIVTRRLVLLSGPHLVLNTNYSQTDVPVPDGIRSAGQPTALVK